MYCAVLAAVFFVTLAPAERAAAAQTASSTLAGTTSTSSSAYQFLGNQNIAPVVFIRDNTPTGVAVDITKALEPYLSKPLEIKAMDWPTAQGLVAAGNADALIQINPTEERKKIYDFSDPLLESQFSIFSRTDRVDIRDLASIHGMRVGVEEGGLPQQILLAHPEIQLVIIPNFLDGFTQVSGGALDAVVVDRRVGSYVLAINNIRNITAIQTPIVSSFSAFAVKKGNTTLLNEINAALRVIRSNGMYQAILTKWEPTETVIQTQQQVTRETLSAILVVLTVLFLAIVAWSVVTSRELKKRKEAEQFSSKLVSSANAMIVCLNTRGEVTAFNEAAEKISGYRKDEVMGKNWFELVVPHVRFPEVWKVFEEFQKEGKSIVGEFKNPILTKKGEERIIEWRNSDLTDDGNVIGTISYGIDVTERERAEATSRLTAAIVESSDDAIYSKTPESIITTWNKGAEIMYGFTAEEMVGRPIELIVPENKREELAALINRIKKGERVHHFETVRMAKNGRELQVSISLSPVIDEHGKLTSIAAIARDITERKKAEAVLRNISQYTRSLIESSLDPLVTISAEGKITDVNAATEAVTGYARSKLINTDFSDYFSNPDKAREGYEKVFREGMVRDYPLEIRHKEGHLTPVLYNASVYKDADGNVVGVFAAARDITERKRAEALIRENEEDLREAQRIGRFGHFDWDARTDTIKWSDEYYHIYGIPLGTEPPGYEEHLKIYTQDSAARLDAAVKHSMATGKPYVIDLEQVNPPKGAARWITARGEVKQDEHGKIIGLRGTAQDITDRKLSEERIKDLSELRSKFLNIMAHQLRTPLSSVNWNLEMLLGGDLGKLEETQKKFLQVTYSESKKITNRIRDLLAAVDIEDNRVLIRKERVALDDVVFAAISEAKNRAALKEIALNYTPPEKPLPRIVGDEEKLRIVISQLLENAVTYTPEKGTVSVILDDHHGALRFEVKDTGIGIPENEQKHIFDRFFRASNASQMHPDGFGLGLYVFKYFIEQHGGTMGFTSTEGKGSTFWFELPTAEK